MFPRTRAMIRFMGTAADVTRKVRHGAEDAYAHVLGPNQKWLGRRVPNAEGVMGPRGWPEVWAERFGRFGALGALGYGGHAWATRGRPPGYQGPAPVSPESLQFAAPMSGYKTSSSSSSSVAMTKALVRLSHIRAGTSPGARGVDARCLR